MKKKYTCHSSDRVLNLPKARPLRKDLAQSDTGQLPSSLHIKVGAPIMLTSNHQKAQYKEDGIMNGARGYIDYIQTNPENEDEVEIIWVVFNNRETGAKYRVDHYDKRGSNYSLDKYSTPIFPVKKRFKVNFGNVEYQRKMFPITLAYALTAHKCQGETFKGGVIVDFADGFIMNGSFYVAISRVTTCDKLFLRSFDLSYVKVNKGVEEKIENMRKDQPYKFKKTYLD